MKDKNEQRVERDVCGGSDEGGRHARGGISLRDDVLIQSDGGDGKEGTRRIDEQVLPCVWIGAVAGAEGVQQGALKDKDDRHDKYGQSEQGDQGVCKDLPGTFLLFFAESHGKQRCSARSDEKGKGRNDGGNGGAHAHGGERRIADLLNISHENSIHDGV